jgi:hypothetical protein
VYSTADNAVYFIPNYRNNGPWPMIDGSGAVSSYSLATNYSYAINPYQYFSATYCSANGRVYMIPYGNGGYYSYALHFIAGGIVYDYTATPSGTYWNLAYIGGAYLPTIGKIYMIPYYYGYSYNQWHRIDVATNALETYNAVYLSDSYYYSYRGGAYHPGLDRLIFAPYYAQDDLNLYYIDGATGSLGSISNTMNLGLSYYYAGYKNAYYNSNDQKVTLFLMMILSQVQVLHVGITLIPLVNWDRMRMVHTQV